MNTMQRPWFKVIALLAAITLVALSIEQFFIRDPRSTPIHKQIELLKRASVSKAYYLTTSQNFQKTNSLDDFRDWLHEHPELVSYQDLQLRKTHDGNDRATILAEFIDTRGKDYLLSYELVKDKGKWKIDQVYAEDNAVLAKQRDSRTLLDQDEITKQVVKTVEELQNHEWEEVYQNELAAEFKLSVSYREFRKTLENHPPLAHFSNYQLSAPTKEEGMVAYRVRFIDSNYVTPVDLWLCKEQANWKIWAIDFVDPETDHYYEMVSFYEDDLADLNDEEEEEQDEVETMPYAFAHSIDELEEIALFNDEQLEALAQQKSLSRSEEEASVVVWVKQVREHQAATQEVVADAAEEIYSFEPTLSEEIAALDTSSIYEEPAFNLANEEIYSAEFEAFIASVEAELPEMVPSVYEEMADNILEKNFAPQSTVEEVAVQKEIEPSVVPQEVVTSNWSRTIQEEPVVDEPIAVAEEVIEEPVAVVEEAVTEEPIALIEEEVFEEPVVAVEEIIVEEPIAVAEEVIEEPVAVVEEVIKEPIAVVEEAVIEEPIALIEEGVFEEPVVAVEEIIVEEPIAVVEEVIEEPVVVVEEVIEEPIAVVEEAVVEESIALVEEEVFEDPVIATEEVIEEPIAVVEEVIEEPIAVIEETVVEEPIALVEEEATEEPVIATEEIIVEEPVAFVEEQSLVFEPTLPEESVVFVEEEVLEETFVFEPTLSEEMVVECLAFEEESVVVAKPSAEIEETLVFNVELAPSPVDQDVLNFDPLLVEEKVVTRTTDVEEAVAFEELPHSVEEIAPQADEVIAAELDIPAVEEIVSIEKIYNSFIASPETQSLAAQAIAFDVPDFEEEIAELYNELLNISDASEIQLEETPLCTPTTSELDDTLISSAKTVEEELICTPTVAEADDTLISIGEETLEPESGLTVNEEVLEAVPQGLVLDIHEFEDEIIALYNEILLLSQAAPEEATPHLYEEEIVALADEPAPATEKKALTPPQQVVQQQLDLIRKGEDRKAYDETSSKEFKEATSFENFKAFINTYPEFTKSNKFEFKEEFSQEGLKVIRVLLISDEGESVVDFWLSKVDEQWKVFGIRVESSFNYPPIKKEELAELLTVIEDQLTAIKKNDLSKAYYAFVASDFEENTPFEDFKAFIEEYPIFTQETKLTVGESVVEGNVRVLRLSMESPSETTEVVYRLIQEEGKWRIWGIQVLASERFIPQKKQDIKDIILSQLKEIQLDDLGKAYYAFTSEEFQQNANFEAFKDFLNKFVILKTFTNSEVSDIHFNGNLADAKVTLSSLQTPETYFNYRFIWERGKWRILGIKEITYADKQSKQKNTRSQIEITKITIGTETDQTGKVLTKKTTFSPEDREIDVNVFVKNGDINDDITAELRHLDSNSSITPITADVESRGSSFVSFLFTSPPNGWPIGKYQLKVTSNAGQTEVLLFTVRLYQPTE